MMLHSSRQGSLVCYYYYCCYYWAGSTIPFHTSRSYGFASSSLTYNNQRRSIDSHHQHAGTTRLPFARYSTPKTIGSTIPISTVTSTSTSSSRLFFTSDSSSSSSSSSSSWIVPPKWAAANCRDHEKTTPTTSTTSLSSTSSSSSSSNNDNDNKTQQEQQQDEDGTNHYQNHLQDVTELKNHFFALRHGQSMANVQKIIASNPSVACYQYGLSPLGQEQAKKAGKDILETYFNGIVINDNNDDTKGNKEYQGIIILSSDLLRAKETAEIVATVIQQEEKEKGIKILKKFQMDDDDDDDNDNTTSSSSSTNNHQGSSYVVIEKQLRERNFGNYDLQNDIHYNKVWENDQIDPYHTIDNVESVMSVMDRVTKCIIKWDNDTNNTNSTTNSTSRSTSTLTKEDYMILCVAHGDVLQILQTSFAKLNGSKHRSLEHLETATLRKLPLIVQ